MFPRIIGLREILAHSSVFLFGPRQTGKSTLLRTLFPQAKFYDLLEADTFRELSSAPELIRQRLRAEDTLVIIDEIQKLPSLLDEVHLLIERNKPLRFVLTGSSARKLRRGGANLLAGRALTCHLHPLVAPEVGYERVHQRLNNGSLPAIFTSPIPQELLRAYVGTYLQEEILAEGLVRNIGSFSRFLSTAGLTNGEQVNFTAVGSDTGTPPRTVREYYHVLEDTLVGYLLPTFQKTRKRKPVSTPKFYFFDVGVANVLAKRGPVEPGSELFGRALEHFVFLELRAYLDYRRLDHQLTYWRSRSQFEVDFVIGDEVAVEVKGKSLVSNRDLKGLQALSEDVTLRRQILVCTEREPRRLDDGIDVLPIETFLRKLWGGEILP
jgi:predicted AAA+ superfamily ATPase